MEPELSTLRTKLHLDLPKEHHISIVMNLGEIRTGCLDRLRVIIMHDEVLRFKLITVLVSVTELKHAVVTSVSTITDVNDPAQ